MADKPVTEVVAVDAALDALSSPTSSDVYDAVDGFNEKAVAAAAAARALAGGVGSQPVEHVVVPIVFNTPGLVIPASGPAGILLTDIAPGDLLLGALNQTPLSITTAWDGTGAPTLYICLEEDRGDLPGTAPVAERDYNPTQVDQDVTPASSGTIVSLQSGALFDPTTDLCVIATGLYAYVDDGAGGDPGSSQGEGAIHLFIARAP